MEFITTYFNLDFTRNHGTTPERARCRRQISVQKHFHRFADSSEQRRVFMFYDSKNDSSTVVATVSLSSKYLDVQTLLALFPDEITRGGRCIGHDSYHRARCANAIVRSVFIFLEAESKGSYVTIGGVSFFSLVFSRRYSRLLAAAIPADCSEKSLRITSLALCSSPPFCLIFPALL